tara:strand:+ start:183 stop:401 length:219 start_codon:yes stop_codon:yes gene_type:complete
MSEITITREHKVDAILEYWEEGWLYNDYGDVIAEMRALHTGEKPLCQWSDNEVDAEYENTLEYFKELDGEQK